MKKSQKGFTLVELIVVIAIIGVLAAILVPAMMGYIKDSKITSANASAKTVYTAIQGFAQKAVNAGSPMAANVYSGAVAASGAEAKVSELKAGTITVQVALERTVNNTLGKDAIGSQWKVRIGTEGFPEECAWAKSTTDVYVGCYPTASEDDTTGGIDSFNLPA